MPFVSGAIKVAVAGGLALGAYVKFPARSYPPETHLTAAQYHKAEKELGAAIQNMRSQWLDCTQYTRPGDITCKNILRKSKNGSPAMAFFVAGDTYTEDTKAPVKEDSLNGAGIEFTERPGTQAVDIRISFYRTADAADNFNKVTAWSRGMARLFGVPKERDKLVFSPKPLEAFTFRGVHHTVWHCNSISRDSDLNRGDIGYTKDADEPIRVTRMICAARGVRLADLISYNPA